MNGSYDPSQDPRSLEQDSALIAHIHEERVAELVAELDMLNEFMTLFEYPAWVSFFNYFTNERALHAERLVNGFCQSLGDFQHERGRVKSYDHLLGLPDATRIRREGVLQELEQLSEDGSR